MQIVPRHNVNAQLGTMDLQGKWWPIGVRIEEEKRRKD
jgi:hypothetical protein